MSFKEDQTRRTSEKSISDDWKRMAARNSRKRRKSKHHDCFLGGVGVMWGRNVAFIVIRPQRYTKEFI